MTPFLLAQTLPEPSSAAAVGWFIGVLLVLAAGALIFKQLFKSDPPMHKEYVSRQEHEKHRDDMAKELARHAARRAEIYEEQKKQGEKLARLEVSTERQNQDLKTIKEELSEANERIDQVPQRTIDLLLDAQKVMK